MIFNTILKDILNKFAEKKCALHTENNDNKAHFKSQCRDKRIFTFPALS